MMAYNNKGWVSESARHSLAAKGIKTGAKNNKAGAYLYTLQRERLAFEKEPTLQEQIRSAKFGVRLTRAGIKTPLLGQILQLFAGEKTKQFIEKTTKEGKVKFSRLTPELKKAFSKEKEKYKEFIAFDK